MTFSEFEQPGDYDKSSDADPGNGDGYVEDANLEGDGILAQDPENDNFTDDDDALARDLAEADAKATHSTGDIAALLPSAETYREAFTMDWSDPEVVRSFLERNPIPTQESAPPPRPHRQAEAELDAAQRDKDAMADLARSYFGRALEEAGWMGGETQPADKTTELARVVSWPQVSDAIRRQSTGLTYREKLHSLWNDEIPEEQPDMASETRDGTEAAFLDSLEVRGSNAPEPSMSELKAAGAVVVDALSRQQNEEFVHQRVLGATAVDMRHDPATGKTYQIDTIRVDDQLAYSAQSAHIVSIRESETDHPGAGAFYEVGTDGVVRRTDIPEPTDAERRVAEATLSSVHMDEPFADTIRERLATKMTFAAQVLRNHIHATQSTEGNYAHRQPIGIDEATRLASLILRRPYEPQDPTD